MDQIPATGAGGRVASAGFGPVSCRYSDSSFLGEIAVSDVSAARRSPLPSVGVGLVTAVVGAVLWAVLVNVTHYKIGYAAVGLGLLVGLAMARTAPAWRPLPFVAAVVALFGCLLGDALVDATVLADVVGISTVEAFRQMVGDPTGLGREVFSAGFEGIDAVFWLIAAFAAFRLARGAMTRTAAVASTLPAAAGLGAPSGVTGQQMPWSPPPVGGQPPLPGQDGAPSAGSDA
jgi:hypothetical protein